MSYTSTVNYIQEPTLFDGEKIEFDSKGAASVAKISPNSPVYSRAQEMFSQEYYSYPAPPLFLGATDLQPPEEPLYVLRLLIKQPDSQFIISEKLLFAKDLIASCAAYQKQHFPDYENRFVYLTVRSGEVRTSRDDEFHVDGFQGLSVPRHIPEQNYLWASAYPTIFSLQPYFVERLHPMQHNVHAFFDQHTDRSNLYKGVDNGLYIIDPYHVHARQTLPAGVRRTVLRLTFSPVEIRDDTNMVNKWLPRGPYNRDDIRNALVSYEGPEIDESLGLQRPALGEYCSWRPDTIEM